MEKYEVQDILKGIFKEEDYLDFLNIVNDKDGEISKIDKCPVINYNHNIIEDCDVDLIVSLYQNIRYYLQEEKFYTPKLAEGISLCATKVAIINYYFPSRLDSYFKMGNRTKSQGKSNPFEEISRLLLCALKEEYLPNNFQEQRTRELSFGKIEFDNNASIDIIKKSLNKDELLRTVNNYSAKDVIGIIGEDLELSDINSNLPSGASKKENREVLMEQLNRIKDIYTTKLECKAFLGQIISNSFHSKLLLQFDNVIFYARRNIGIYEQTKQLRK